MDSIDPFRHQALRKESIQCIHDQENWEDNGAKATIRKSVYGGMKSGSHAENPEQIVCIFAYLKPNLYLQPSPTHRKNDDERWYNDNEAGNTGLVMSEKI